MLNLKKYRELKGLSQAAVARAIGISRQVYNNYELGKREADYETLLKLAEYLDTTVESLITDRGTSIELSKKTSETDKNAELKFALFGDADVDDEILDDVKRYAKIARQMREEQKGNK